MPTKSFQLIGHFTIAMLMEFTAACAMAASVVWLVGYAASGLLVLASLGLLFRQGWLVLVSLTIMLMGIYEGSLLRPEKNSLTAIAICVALIGTFAGLRILLRRSYYS